jgi:CHAT domain-containing protein
MKIFFAKYQKKRTKFAISFLIIFWASLFFVLGILPVFSQNSTEIDVDRLVQQADGAYRSGDLLEAADKLEKVVNIFEDRGDREIKNLAISSTNLCRVQLELGQAKNALQNCQTATQIYRHLEDESGRIRAQIYQASALQKLGFYPKACILLSQSVGVTIKTCDELTSELLQEKIQNIDRQSNSYLLVAWRILADNLRVMGDLNKSAIILKNINLISSDTEPAATLLSLGNTEVAIANLERDRQAEPQYNYLPWHCQVNSLAEPLKKNYQVALETYNKAIEKKSSLTLKIKAQLNRLRVFLELDRYSEAAKLAEEIKLENLPLSQYKIYATINFSKSLACLQQKYWQKEDAWTNIIDRLNRAILDAKQIGDRATESYALGSLGGLYEYLDKFTEAEVKTQEALYLAQELPSLAYQWEWQLGRIYEAKQEREKALDSYELAVKDLDISRQDILAINSDVQFSFRDNVEPLYRQLVELLLKNQDLAANEQNSAKIIYYIEALQLAELSNFLRCNPEDFSLDLQKEINIPKNKIETFTQKLDRVHQTDPNAAVIYPIVLADRLAIVLSLPGENIRVRTVPISAANISQTVNNLRQYLQTPRRDRQFQELSQQLYNWLISPLENDLNRAKQIKTLVFILDSALQNIPMSALFDGQHYLIEKYAVNLIPSLQLLSPQIASREQISVLMGGATDAPSFERENLNALPNVEKELEGISREVSRKKQLLQQDFVEANIQQQINSSPFSIVHIATHGNFSSNPEQTYVLDWTRRIKIEDLERLLRLNRQRDKQPIDLLILSACETATGDRRAALGLAGVAIRAGARSTIATLWQVNDASTAELMIQFYQNLQNPQLTKAEALRQAQLKLLNKENYLDRDYNRAYYWAPFVIVGNWL